MKKLNFLVMAVVLFILPCNVLAKPSGSIEGRVVDIETERPLFNVNVFLKGTGIGDATDLQGRYRITGVPAGKYEVVATIVGYRKESQAIEVPPNQTIEVDFKLKESPISMDEVVVTGTKTKHLIDESPVPIRVIGEKDISRYNALNVGESMDWLAGVQFNTSFTPMAHDALQIQGLPSVYSLILLDGERIGGRFPLTQISADMVERIEVVKGPTSVLYGSDAMGGVCNIITKKQGEKPFLKGTVSYGSYSDKVLSLTHGGAIGKFRYQISGYLHRTEGRDKMSWHNSENGIVKLGYKKDWRNELNIRGRAHHAKLSNREERMFNLSLDGKVGLPNLSNLVVKAHREDFHDETHVGGAEEATITDGEVNRVELRWTGAPFEKHLTIAGLEGLYEKMGGGNFVEPKSQYMGSFYLQDEMIYEPLTLLLAGRLDYHERWGSSFNPKIAVRYEPIDKLFVRASVGNAFKAPTFKHLYRRTYHAGGGGFWIIGNPELEAEKSTGYNLELCTHISDIRGSVSFFRHDLKDMIDGEFINDSTYSYTNIGKAYTQGVEADISSKLFIEGLTGKIKYEFLETKDERTGYELTYRPHHRVNIETSYLNKELGLTLTLLEEYVGSQIDWRGDTLPSYLLTHLRINKTFFGKTALFLSVNNLFDKKYRDRWIYRDAHCKRTYKVGLRVNFE